MATSIQNKKSTTRYGLTADQWNRIGAAYQLTLAAAFACTLAYAITQTNWYVFVYEAARTFGIAP